jgi:CDP-2,3-bis-(O-geranylgeranyl)-sn-glycerol synthase
MEAAPMQPWLIAQMLILLALANGTPVFASKIFGGRFSRPIDGGMRFLDGRPLFGPSKTIRGALLAILATTAGAPLIGLDWKIGTVMGLSAMIGDLISSFTKRRLAMASSSQASGLDQIPESLLPLLACRGALALTYLDMLIVLVLFFVGEVLLSRLLFKLGLRDRPY